METRSAVLKQLDAQETRRGQQDQTNSIPSTSGRTGYGDKKDEQEEAWCILCREIFPTENELKLHRREAHRITKADKKYPCPLPSCEKGFNTKKDFQSHKKSHEGESNYTCEKCSKAFVWSEQLQYHVLRTHSAKDKQFVTKNNQQQQKEKTILDASSCQDPSHNNSSDDDFIPSPPFSPPTKKRKTVSKASSSSSLKAGSTAATTSNCSHEKKSAATTADVGQRKSKPATSPSEIVALPVEPALSSAASSSTASSSTAIKKRKRSTGNPVEPALSSAASSSTAIKKRKRLTGKQRNAAIRQKIKEGNQTDNKTQDKDNQQETKEDKENGEKYDYYTRCMSLNAILQDNNIVKEKIEHDIDILSRIKIITCIFVDFMMNKPQCKLSQLYAKEGIPFTEIMALFKKRSEKLETEFKEKHSELYELFEEFKTVIKDEENEFDSHSLKEFEKLHHEKKEWKDKSEKHEEFHKFRMEKLTKYDCANKTALIEQAGKDMKKDLLVHLNIQGPKILEKYFRSKISEGNNQEKEQSDKQENQSTGKKTPISEQKNKKKKQNTNSKKNETKPAKEEGEGNKKKEKNSKNRRRMKNWEKKIENKITEKQARQTKQVDVEENEGSNEILSGQELRKKRLKIQNKKRNDNRLKELKKLDDDYDKSTCKPWKNKNYQEKKNNYIEKKIEQAASTSTANETMLGKNVDEVKGNPGTNKNVVEIKKKGLSTDTKQTIKTKQKFLKDSDADKKNDKIEENTELKDKHADKDIKKEIAEVKTEKKQLTIKEINNLADNYLDLLLVKNECSDETINNILKEINKEYERFYKELDEEANIKKKKSEEKRKEDDDDDDDEDEKQEIKKKKPQKKGKQMSEREIKFAEEKEKKKKEKERAKKRKPLQFTDLVSLYTSENLLPFFMKLQRHYIDNGKTSFVLFPERRYGVQHATYTKSVFLRDVLRYVRKKEKDQLKEKQIAHLPEKHVSNESAVLNKMNKNEQMQYLWERLFNITEVMEKNKKFLNLPNLIHTDGVKVSLVFASSKLKQKARNIQEEEQHKELDKKEQEDSKDEKGHQQKDENQEKNEAENQEEIQVIESSCKYTRFVGLDPGRKAIVGGIVRKGDPKMIDDKEQDSPLYGKAKSFRFRAGEYRRREILKKKTADADKKYETLIKTNPKFIDIDKKNPLQYKEVAKFRFKLFEIYQDSRSRRGVTQLKFNKMVLVQRETDRLVNKIMGNVKENPCFVGIGNHKLPNWTKGHVMTPIRSIVSRLQERSKQVGEDKLKIVNVQEYFTTQKCSTCCSQCFVSLYPKRYAFCKKCSVTWERDVNAGRNILNLNLIKENLMKSSDLADPSVFPQLKESPATN